MRVCVNGMSVCERVIVLMEIKCMLISTIVFESSKKNENAETVLAFIFSKSESPVVSIL